MLKYNEREKIDSISGALNLRTQVEKIVDDICVQKYDNIFFIGIGGTWASSLQVEVYVKSKSAVPIFVENASEFITTGNKRISKDSIVVFSSVTGSTEEMLKALKKVKDIGAKIVGFIDVKNTPLEEYCDWCISYPMNEQLKFFMFANRLMYNNGDFSDYNKYNDEMEKYLPSALVEVSKKSDEWAMEFAENKYAYYKKHPEMPHYFVGAGNQWGATYSYAMCYWEEQLWIRTKSITSSEFFHGMLEIVEAETPVTVFVGEDEQRPLSERVVNFLPKICKNFVVIDTKDYELKGISPEYRGSISHLVMNSVNDRINVHMENEFKHPMEIRRYYRQLDY